MYRVIKNEVKGQYAVWKFINGKWKLMSSYYYAESNAINVARIMASMDRQRATQQWEEANV